MIKILIPLSLTFLISCLHLPVIAQQCNPGTLACVDTLASNVAIVSSSGTYNYGDTCVWVCTGTTVNLTNSPLGHGLNNVYVEGNATVNISSNINGVLAKAGAVVNLLSGSSGTLVICEPGAAITQNGLPWSGSCSCNKVVFDYSYAPAAQSCISTGSNEKLPIASFKIYPNPANDIVTITINGVSDIDEITLSNALGETLRSYSVKSEQLTFNTSSLEPGSYFITAKESETTSAVRKLIIVR